MEQIFRALADGSRRKIIQLLKKEAMTPTALSEELDLSRSTISGHLRVLYDAQLVEKERKGNSIWYFLNMTVLEDLLYYLGAIIFKEGEDAEKV